MPDLTETYQFAPAWFTRIGDGNPLTGLQRWLDDPFAAQAPDDEENHTYFFAEALIYHLLVTAVLWLFSFGDVQDQVLALRAHESFHCLSYWLQTGEVIPCNITLTHPAEWGGLHVAYADLYIPTDHTWSVPLTATFIAAIAWMIMDTGGD